MDHGTWHKRGAHHDTGALSQLRRANVFSGPRRLKNVSTTGVDSSGVARTAGE